MSNTAEKLVYLQNGVFKRKELSDGLQYYSDNSFDTFALPPDNGNYVLTKGDNGLLTWTDAGTVVPEQPEEFTTLDNSYFKDSNSQAITIAARGTIPYFKTNATFGKLDLPGSGKYLLNIEEDGEPSFSTFSKSMINTTLGFGNTSNKYAIVNWNSITGLRKNLFLPDEPGAYILKATDAGAFGNEYSFSELNAAGLFHDTLDIQSTKYSFSELNAAGLFHDTLDIQSTTLSLIAYKGNTALGVTVPAMNNSSGYFVFKNEVNNEVPRTSVLTPRVIYRDILGCTSTERCLVQRWIECEQVDTTDYRRIVLVERF